ncbi:hypothetical protein M3Y98_01092300 [Aphelenchoides besseyi]|nr:hypothetical protein M3Y98_01092300 [Aphelenchoides besseyi]KAI6209402.1 hypothetical protein M3Y96_00217900 [Aphelenchoides besseyi]
MAVDGVETLERVVAEFASPENEHKMVMDLITTLHQNVIPTRRPVVKKFLMAKLKKYSSSSTSRQVQREILPMWLLLAEFSNTMDIQKVLDNVSHLYQDYLPFYHAYINELVRLGNEERAKEMAFKCKINCRLSDEEMAKEFPMFVQQEDDDVTSVLFDATILSRQNKHKLIAEVTIHENALEEEEDSDEDTITTMRPQLNVQVAKPKDDSVVLPRASNDVSIKQIVDCYKTKHGQTGSFIASFICSQLADQLDEMVKKGRVVINLNPDNVVVTESIPADDEPKGQILHPIVKVCQHSASDPGKENQNRMTVEFLKIAGWLLFGAEFQITENDGEKVSDHPIPRRHFDRNVWVQLFGSLLNNESEEKVDWNSTAELLRTNFISEAEKNRFTWKTSVNDFNEILTSNLNSSF